MMDFVLNSIKVERHFFRNLLNALYNLCNCKWGAYNYYSDKIGLAICDEDCLHFLNEKFYYLNQELTWAWHSELEKLVNQVNERCNS